MKTRTGVAVVIAALVIGVGVAAAATWNLQEAGKLRDLQLTSDPTDGVVAHLKGRAGDGSSHVELTVTGLKDAVVGRTFGAHLHTGTCESGPHYQVAGATPLSEREVWLDFTVQQGGVAHSSADVAFEVDESAVTALVVHINPTNQTTGAAGTRLACLELQG
jgi:Cu/Zn superoxide dismutase